jgi:hypothetical protein
MAIPSDGCQRNFQLMRNQNFSYLFVHCFGYTLVPANTMLPVNGQITGFFIYIRLTVCAKETFALSRKKICHTF